MGSLARLSKAAILLPFASRRWVQLRLTARANGRNVGRTVDLSIGGHQRPLVLSGEDKTYRFTVKLDDPAKLIKLGTFDVEPEPNAADTRSMGIRLVSLGIQRVAISFGQGEEGESCLQGCSIAKSLAASAFS